MACNRCKKQKCNCQNSQCFDLDQQSCKTPCENGVMSTDCIFYNIEGGGQHLKGLNIKTSTSLTRILKSIDSVIKTGNISLAGINWYELNETEKNLSTPFNAIQFIADILHSLKEEDSAIIELISSIQSSLQLLTNEVDEINSPLLSSSKVGVNTTDDLKECLNKILSFIDEFPEPIVNNYNVNAEISSAQGNKLIQLPNGLYVPDTSASTVLQEICDVQENTEKFKMMVRKAGLKHKFHLSNSHNSSVQVQYTTADGNAMSVAVPANGSITIDNVRKLDTSPTSTLTITYLGNEL